MSYDARYDIPRSPHFPMESVSTCAEAARLTYDFVTSLFKASVTPSENSADLDELQSRRCVIDETDANIRSKILQVEILRRALRLAKDQLADLRTYRDLLVFESNAISRPSWPHLPLEILAKIDYADYRNEIAEYERNESATIAAPIERDPWHNVHRTMVPVHIGRFPGFPSHLDDEQIMVAKVRHRCVRSDPAKLLIYIQAQSTPTPAMDVALEFAHRWHTLVLDGTFSESLILSQLLQHCQAAFPFLQKLIIIPEILANETDSGNTAVSFPPGSGADASRIRVAHIPFGYLSLTQVLFLHVTQLSILSRGVISVDEYHVLRDSLSAMSSLKSLAMTGIRWAEQTPFEARIVLPNLGELAIEGHIINDVDSIVHACKAFECTSLQKLRAPIFNTDLEVGRSLEHSSKDIAYLTNQVNFKYPHVSELSLLTQYHVEGQFIRPLGIYDRRLRPFLRRLARPSSEGEWLFPALIHLTIPFDYGHVSHAVEDLIPLCRSRRNNSRTLPLRTIELHGVGGDEDDMDAIDQLSFWVHDVIVRY